jgi:hypothetical protein
MENANKYYKEVMNETQDENVLQTLELLTQYNKSQSHFLKNKPKITQSQVQNTILQQPNHPLVSSNSDSDSNTKKTFSNLLLEPWDEFYLKLEAECDSQELKQMFLGTISKIQKNVKYFVGKFLNFLKFFKKLLKKKINMNFKE